MYWACDKVGGHVLVDINLLPQKEKNHSWARLSMVVGLSILAVLAAAGWIYVQSLSQKADSLKKQSAQNQQLLQIYAKNAQSSTTTPFDELRNAVDWAQTNRKETYLLLQKITALLPERGYIQNFSFEATGSATLSIQFDSTKQAADFLHNLQTSAFIKKAELQSITAANIGDTDTANVNRYQNELPRYVANYQLDIKLQALRAKSSSAEVSP